MQPRTPIRCTSHKARIGSAIRSRYLYIPPQRWDRWQVRRQLVKAISAIHRSLTLETRDLRVRTGSACLLGVEYIVPNVRIGSKVTTIVADDAIRMAIVIMTVRKRNIHRIAICKIVVVHSSVSGQVHSRIVNSMIAVVMVHEVSSVVTVNLVIVTIVGVTWILV